MANTTEYGFLTVLNDDDTYSDSNGTYVVMVDEEQYNYISDVTAAPKPGTYTDRFNLTNPDDLERLAAKIRELQAAGLM